MFCLSNVGVRICLTKCPLLPCHGIRLTKLNAAKTIFRVGEGDAYELTYSTLDRMRSALTVEFEALHVMKFHSFERLELLYACGGIFFVF